MIGYALILQFVYKDGRILQLTVTANPFAPFQQFLALFDIVARLQIAALGALAAGTWRLQRQPAFLVLRRPSNPLGDAAFQDIASIRRGKWFRKEGHIFGRMGRNILRRQDDRHHLIIGPTRSGKGVGYVIPNALMFPGSMIVTDLKGEIFQQRQAIGSRTAPGVSVLAGGAEDPSMEPAGFRSAGSRQAARSISRTWQASSFPKRIGSENSVWQGTAQQVIAGVISYILESTTLQEPAQSWRGQFHIQRGVDLQALMKLIKEKEPYLSRFTVESFNAYISL